MTVIVVAIFGNIVEEWICQKAVVVAASINPDGTVNQDVVLVDGAILVVVAWVRKKEMTGINSG